MAAAVRNNVWVAPGQDAQFLLKTTAPLTADGRRGEDHGQVLCNTRDAILGTSSFHDYDLVGDSIFLFASAARRHSLYGRPQVWRRKIAVCVSDQRRTDCFRLKGVTPMGKVLYLSVDADFANCRENGKQGIAGMCTRSRNLVGGCITLQSNWIF